jgi:putative ubiquitin-RnfH superfamily antitoxin RatB of RatAB toxin-antitoxin module
MSDDMIRVEVAYALPEKQKIIEIHVEPGTTMYQAAVASGITEHFEDLDLEKAPMGIFGKAEGNPKKREMKDGERVEIYRPLIADPKAARKARAEKKRQTEG